MTDEQREFNKFQIQEHISFISTFSESSKSIATFFRYYLLIFAIPVPLFLFLINKGIEPFTFSHNFLIWSGVSIIVLAVFCFCILINIISSRHQTINYARCVNGIRGYFHNATDEPQKKYGKFCVFAMDIYAPSFFEWEFFISIICGISIMNSFIMGIGLFIASSEDLKFSIPLAIMFLLIHLLYYLFISKYKDCSKKYNGGLYFKQDEAHQ